MTDGPALLQRRFALAEVQRNVWFATLEANLTIEDALEPSYWRHVVQQLRPYDLVEIGNDDCSFRAQLIVADVWHAGARLVEISRVNMAGEEHEDKSVGDDLKVRWRGPHAQWCVVRSDNVVLRSNLPDKNVALENLTALAQERAAVGN